MFNTGRIFPSAQIPLHTSMTPFLMFLQALTACSPITTIKSKRKKIELFPDSSKVVLSSPTGKLQPSAFSKNDGVQFSCDKLIWERAPQVLTLRGNITVIDEGIGDDPLRRRSRAKTKGARG